MKLFDDTSFKDKIKVTAVSYLNTKPLLYGIFKSPVAQYIDLQLDIPSVCAKKLIEGEADLGLVPVAVIPELKQATIVSDFCIGTVGEVRTVCIYGDVPIEEMRGIYLDYHSRTSVALTKILMREFWNIHPNLIQAHPGYEEKIGGYTGGLVIGDRTMGLAGKYKYSYDLGSAWMAMTNLPFVFAAWVATKPLAQDFLNQFNLALQRGIEEIPQLVYLLPSPSPEFDLKTYFTKFISYNLDELKQKALDLFLAKLKQEKLSENMAF